MPFRPTVQPRDLVETPVPPADSRPLDAGLRWFDFGRAFFGTVVLPSPRRPLERVVVHLGEKLDADGRIDREPPGTVRYRRIEQAVDGSGPIRIRIPADERNTGAAAVLMPDGIGEVLPFRYLELEDEDAFDPAALRQVRVAYPFDRAAASFRSSDPVLDAVWSICADTIEATSFCGVYVDGDRERIPYEGDAYINQLGHYCLEADYALARYSHEYLLAYPTWPTEWQLHSVLMAWADHLYSGETASLAAHYELLDAKTLGTLARADGLISTEIPACDEAFERRLNLHHERWIFRHGLRDLVDWPPGSFTQGGQGERDGHDMRPVNTVVNAFHYRSLVLMARIARTLGRSNDADDYQRRAERVHTAFNASLFDPVRGVYVDGEGSDHASQHSNLFALAFDLVPEERRASVLALVVERGMACSVYAAQFLLEALYRHGADDAALALMTARGDRGWYHMIEQGSTMTWEAWDHRYKNNLDWNHAWGAAPGNVIPRWLMGIRPLEAGWRRTLIQPRPGGLAYAECVHPTPHGPLRVAVRQDGDGLQFECDIPAGITARIELPVPDDADSLRLNGRCVPAERHGRFLVLPEVAAGTHVVAPVT